jgi:hypothetical protein
MGRPALQVRVRIQDTDIDLIAAHFKSKLLTFPQPIQPPRRGRARPVRCLRPVPPCRRSCHRPRHRHGPPGHHPDPQRPDRVRDRHRRPQPARPRRPTAAVDLAPSIPEAQRFSRICRGREELIDHIFVSHALGRGAEHPDLITALCSHRSTYSRGRDTWRDHNSTERGRYLGRCCRELLRGREQLRPKTTLLLRPSRNTPLDSWCRCGHVEARSNQSEWRIQ